MSGGFGLEKFIESFPTLAESHGGTEALRELALWLAFQGRFTGTKRLVPTEVRGSHKPIAATKGRDATTMVTRGRAALAVGAAEMMIPEGWEWLPLVSVARLESGHTPSRNHSDYWDGGVPWIGIRDARIHNYGWIQETEQTVSSKGLENSSARLLPAGTVCLSRTASVGYVTIMKRSMATSQDFVNWVCGERILPEFLMNLLRCERQMLRSFSKGAVHQTIYFPEVKAFHVALPTLVEQRRIVAKVEGLMRLIDDLEAKQTKKREVQTRFRASALDALAKAEGAKELGAAWKRVAGNLDVLLDQRESIVLLRATIVDLASRGRLVAQDAREEPTSAVLSKRAVERRKLWEEQEVTRQQRAGKRPRNDGWKAAYSVPRFEFADDLPTIPATWEYVSIGLLGEDHFSPVQTGPFGAQLHSSEFVAHGVPVIAVGNLTGAGFTTKGLYFVTKAKAEQLARYDVQAGDLLFARSGATLGKVCVAPPSVCDWRMTGHILRVRLDRRAISAEVASLWLWAGAAVKRQVMSTIRGGTRPGYNTTLLENIVLPVPPLAEQKRIVAKVDSLMKLCDDLEAKLAAKEATAGKLVEAVVRELSG